MTTHPESKVTRAQFTASALTYASLRRYPTQGLYSSSWLYQIRASRNEDGSLGTRISSSVVDLAYSFLGLFFLVLRLRFVRSGANCPESLS